MPLGPERGAMDYVYAAFRGEASPGRGSARMPELRAFAVATKRIARLLHCGIMTAEPQGDAREPWIQLQRRSCRAAG